jgi:two-component sensor histidine kinase
MVNKKIYGALKISVIYFVAGCIWIFSSDTILEILIPDRGEYAVFQTYKGWIFILISSILLFFLLYKELKKRDVIESNLIENLQEKRVLLNEVHHRVNNNLNSIISLLYLENSKAESPDSKQIIETLTGRIYSMALVHEQLYKSKDFKNISVNDYIPVLVSYIKGMHPAAGDEIKINYRIGEMALDITKAIPFGMLLNEIISNSFKHAFPGSRGGKITIDVKEENNKCLMAVCDNGIGIPDITKLITEESHGVELIRLLVKQLSGEISSTGSDGLKYNIVFPV